MGDWMARMGASGNAPVAQVICDSRDWTPSAGWTVYGGSDPHTGHVHVTAAPEMNGSPPCA
jgi:hypothetical protein